MGRRRDRGSDKWATVTEAAEALGVTGQAIYNRIKASTIPYEQEIDEGTGRPSYRIDREWLEREVERKRGQGEVERVVEPHVDRGVAEVIATLGEMLETVAQESDARLIDAQNELVRTLAREVLEAVSRNREQVSEAVEHQERNVVEALNQLRRDLARVIERAEEEDRREREYQERNLELQRRNLEIQERTLARFEEMRAEAEAMRAERERAGETERRSWWRRMFGS